ncbi:INT5 protein, partial [Ardeotis kori]|nr:INT5 protein [Ardeotis kori]
AAVRHFFGILRRRDADALWHAGRLLTRLSAASPAAAKAALQLLVEAALRGGNAELFGGKAENRPEKEREESGDASLLDINRRFGGAGRFSGGVWSVFHAGVIGKGLKIPAEPENPPPEEPERNIHVFLTLLLRCSRGCRSGESPSEISAVSVHPEAAKAVAAALVENVCPEAAAGAGELVWPPEEQTRGTVERDLRICRIFR